MTTAALPSIGCQLYVFKAYFKVSLLGFGFDVWTICNLGMCGETFHLVEDMFSFTTKMTVWCRGLEQMHALKVLEPVIFKKYWNTTIFWNQGMLQLSFTDYKYTMALFELPSVATALLLSNEYELLPIGASGIILKL